jgi:hypothetical protein
VDLKGEIAMKSFKRFKVQVRVLYVFVLVTLLFSQPVFSGLAEDIEAVKDILRVNNLPYYYANVSDTANNRIILLSLTPPMSGKISDVPGSIGVLDSLQTFELCGVDVPGLPRTIGNLKALKRFLFVSSPFFLSSFPDEFFNCINIEYLDLSYTKADMFPEGFAKLKKLRVLILNHCGINQLPTWVGELDSLRVLDCSRNPYIKIPAELFKCKKLQKIDFSYSGIKEIPLEIGNCVEIDTLNLLVNTLKTLPPTIANLQAIKYLDLSGNQIRPDSLTSEVKAWADKYDPDWKETQYYPNEIKLRSVSSGTRGR